MNKDGIDYVVRELRVMLEQSKNYHWAFNNRQRAASQKSMEEIEKASSWFQSAADFVTTVRDLSGSILLGAATVATAGAAAAGVGASATVAATGIAAGSTIKITAKYQDSGSVGAAIVEAEQQVLFTVIPFARATKLGTVAKAIVGTVVDTGKALIDGKSLGKAIGIGSINLLTVPGGAALKSDLEFVIGKAAAPVVAKATEDLTKKYFQNSIKHSGMPSIDIQREKQSDFDGLTFGDELFLKLAIIDQSNGVWIPG